jgi:hypothetical protein
VSRVRKLLLRGVCLFRGHVNAMTTLPEDGWGLYAISRLYCSRCDRTEFEPDPWAALARYNAEVGRGVTHEPWYVERMAIQQEYWRERQLAQPGVIVLPGQGE